MAEEQKNIAQEQLPIYEKATAAQAGNTDTQSGTAEGTATSAKIESPQPPASNPGADDATGGIPEGAGGLSSTAHIESPVPNNDQSIFSTVKNMLGFGTTEEIKAEDKEPAEDATTAPSSSLLAGSTIAAAPGVAALTGASTSSSADPATTTTSTSGTTEKGTYLDYQQASSSDTPAFPSSQTLPIRSTPGGSLPSESTSAATKTDINTTSTESTDNKTTTDDSKMADSSNTTERDEPAEHKPPQPADGKPTGGKGLENVKAIPTAGGKRLGEENWGESDIVPDDPKAAAAKEESKAGVSSSEGQPTDQVKDNTAKNTGGASSGPHGHSASGGEEKPKEKLVDKIKDKLHIGSKK